MSSGALETKAIEKKDLRVQNEDPLDTVWPVDVRQFLLWHAIEENQVDSFLGQNGIGGLSLKRVVSGFDPTRTSSVGHDALKSMTPGEKLEVCMGRDSTWPLVKEFIKSNSRVVLSPIIS